jgi:hypothetical protein
MAYFPHAYQKLLVANSFYSTAGNDGTALTAGQLAVIDASTNLTINTAVFPTFATAPKMIYLAQGSFHVNDKIGPYHGGYQETVKSKGINPKYVSAFYRVDDMAPQNNIIQICAAACNLTCNTTYRLRVDVKGSPALRLLTRNAYQVVDAKTACCDPTNPDYIQDPTMVMLGWSDNLTLSPIMNNFVQPHVYVFNTNASLGVQDTNTDAVLGDTFITPSSTTGVVAGQKVVLSNGQTVYVDSVGGGDVNIVDFNGNAVEITTGFTGGTATFYDEVTTGTYTEETDQTALASLLACMDLVGAYVDTTFGDCSFRPTDHFELQPIQIYASTLDENDDPCDTICFTTSTVQEAMQGKGFGETVLRELILAKQYQQEWWTNDVRLREVLDNTSLTEVVRGGKYIIYNILHSVPRKSNPSGMMDNDQYLIRIAVPAIAGANTQFEEYINNLLSVNNNSIAFDPAGSTFVEVKL